MAISRIPNSRISNKCVFISKTYLSIVSNEQTFQSIKHCCKQFSSYCCYLLLHLLDIYSDLILFRYISKTPLIEAKWKTSNAHCFVCVVKITQKIPIVQIPQASELTLYSHCQKLFETGFSHLWLRRLFESSWRVRQFTLPLGWSHILTTPSLEPIPFSCLFMYPFHRWNLNHTERGNARRRGAAAAVIPGTALLISTSVANFSLVSFWWAPAILETALV